MNESELTRLVKPLDIGFTSGRNSPWTICNRGTGAGWKHAFDRKYATHVFLFTLDRSVPFATELTEDGIEEDSAAKYLHDGKSGLLIAIYRYTGWTEENKNLALDHLVKLRQLKREYSWFEAIGKNKFIRTIMPWIGRGDKKETCDENFYTVISQYGKCHCFPVSWEKDSRNIHPYKLKQILDSNSDRFNLVWKLY